MLFRSMGATIRPVARRLLPAALVDEVMEAFDEGTQRAILRLYRSAPEGELERAGAGLGRLTCPALVLWGERDPYIPPTFAAGYAAALGGAARVEVAPGAGHWPWLDAPDLVPLVSDFLLG